MDVRVFFVVGSVREVVEAERIKEVEAVAEAVQAGLRGKRNRIRIMIVSSRVRRPATENISSNETKRKGYLSTETLFS